MWIKLWCVVYHALMHAGHRARGRSARVHGHHPQLAGVRLQRASSEGGWSIPGGTSFLPSPPLPTLSCSLLPAQYLLSDQRFPMDLWMAIGYKEVAFYPQGKTKPLRSFSYEQ